MSLNTVYGQRRHALKKSTQRFELELLSGINLSQVDGDFFTGFDQTGLNGGIGVNTILSPRIRLAINMLYSQKGAKIPHGTIITPQSKNDRILRLNYVEIPIVLRMMINNSLSGPFLEVGTSVSRLTSSDVIERSNASLDGTRYSEIAEEFKNTDVNAIVGLGFTINKRLSLFLRYNYGLTKFYNDSNFIPRNPLSLRPKEVQFLRNYHLAILLSYRIF